MKNKVVSLVASAAIALTPLSPIMAQSETSLAADRIAEAWVPATQDEQEAARGGWVYAVFIAGARVSTLVIKYCGRDSQIATSCAHGAARTFTSLGAAKRWACNRYGRFC